MTEIRKVGVQVGAQASDETQGAKRKPFVPGEVSVWEKTKTFFSGFGEYYADKYEGIKNSKDFIRRTIKIHDEGAEMIDNATFDKIKNWTQSVADRLDDGDDSHLSSGEILWTVTKDVRTIGDEILSTKGIEKACLIIASLGAAGFAI